MTVTFVGLLLLQLRYINQSSNMVREQFGDAVRRSLYRVVCEVEEAEVRKFIDQTLEGEGSCDMAATKEVLGEYAASSARPSVFFSERDSLLVPGEESYYTVKPKGKGSLQNMNKEFNARYYARFMRTKSLLDVVMARLVNEAPNSDITERVDMEALDGMIKTSLHNNGIDLAYHFMVVDRWNNIVYSCHGSGMLDNRTVGYRQRFFPQDKEGTGYYLYLFFPDEEMYYARSMGLLIPSVLLSLLLFATFVLTIIYIFRQKWVNEMKNDFVNNMTHELKTPVSSIQGYLETIVNNENIPREKLQLFLERCYAQSNRLTRLLRDISVLTRMDEAAQMIDMEMVDVSLLVSNIINEVALDLEQRHITVVNSLRPKIQLKGNYSLLYSIFRNLTDNAIAYAGTNIHINISCFREDENFFYFSFADTGVGVPPEHLNRLFERFYRVDKGRSRKLGGTGLGLAIVKNAVLIHGGTISAKNNQGGGLEFVFTLAKGK